MRLIHVPLVLIVSSVLMLAAQIIPPTRYVYQSVFFTFLELNI